MTALLEQAVAQVRQLSDVEQDAAAKLLLEAVAEFQQGKPEELPRPKFGSAKGLIWMAPDFDEPLEDFKDYM